MFDGTPGRQRRRVVRREWMEEEWQKGPLGPTRWTHSGTSRSTTTPIVALEAKLPRKSKQF